MSDDAIQRFDCVSGVDNLADRLRVKCASGHLILTCFSGARKRLARTILIFTERSDQLSRATDRVPGLPASPGYAQ